MNSTLTPLAQIKANPNNPRTIKDVKFKKLVESIRTFPKMLELRPIVVNDDMVVLGGNMRLKACKEAGIKEVPVIKASDLSEEEQRQFIIKDNVGFGDWDWEMLANEWDVAELDAWGMELPKDMFGTDNEVVEDEVPEIPEEPVTKPGDLWILGNHRLLCGDSTNTQHVDRLMNKEQADLIFTDPPWNVNYGAQKNNGIWGKQQRTILNDHMDDDKWDEFVAGFCASFFIASKPGAPIYVVMSAQEWPSLQFNLLKSGFHWSSTIIWKKDSLVISRKDYHTQYEPIWYGWNDKAPRLVQVEDRKQSDVWEVARPKVSELHPTTKPVELVARALNNSSKAGGLVLDLFGGSGSTMIACEQTGRKNCSMELDPKYCDVIVKRWENLTGQKAILEK
jgi:DNA modification methylase